MTPFFLVLFVWFWEEMKHQSRLKVEENSNVFFHGFKVILQAAQRHCCFRMKWENVAFDGTLDLETWTCRTFVFLWDEMKSCPTYWRKMLVKKIIVIISGRGCLYFFFLNKCVWQIVLGCNLLKFMYVWISLILPPLFAAKHKRKKPTALWYN